MENFTQLMSVLQSDDGLKQVMLRPAFEDAESGLEFSQAELIADVINILRMDTKRMGEVHDVPIEINQMTPEHAAELLQGVAKGDDMGLIEIFDEIEDQRMKILEAIEGEDAVEEYSDLKMELLYTTSDPDETTENTDADN
jgi:phage gp29-like protein